MPPLVRRFEDTFGLTHEQIGLLTGSGLIAVCFSTFVAGYLYDRAGARLAVGSSMALMALMALGIFSATSVLAFVVSMILFYMAFGLGNAVNPLMGRLFAPRQDRGLSLAHGIQGLGGLAAPLFVAASLWSTGGWRACFLVSASLLVLLLILFLALFREPQDAASRPPLQSNSHAPQSDTKLGPGIVLGITGLFFATGCEAGLMPWVATFLETESGLTKTASLYALACVMGGYTSIRLLLGAVHRLDPRRVVPLSVVPYLITFMILVNVRDVRLLYPACFVLGLCIGPAWPSLAGAVYRYAPAAHGRITTFMVISSALASATILGMTGWLGSHYSLKHAMMVSPASGVVFAATYVVFARLAARRTDAAIP